MKFSIIIPHYKAGKMTAYCIHQIMKYRGRHEVDIIVVDNTPGGDGQDLQELVSLSTINTLPEHLRNQGYLYLKYPEDLLQSHGIAFDFAVQEIPTITEYFITLESDSFPTNDKWLDYYENLINEGYDMAGSRLKLSGGEYIHPAGAMWRKSLWKEAKGLANQYNSKYVYNENSLKTPEFDYHGMELNLHKCQGNRYSPIQRSVFHQGQAFFNESIHTYGTRNINHDKQFILIPENYELSYKRVGYEPGQWFSYWHYATDKKVFQIPTEIVWMNNRVNQQQEYTLTENGVKHLWGISAYHGASNDELHDIITRKNQVVEELYSTINN